MTRRWIPYGFFLCAALFLVSALGAVVVLTLGTGHREIQRTREKEFSVNLQAAFGKVFISRGDPNKICTIDIREVDRKKPRGVMQYSIVNRIGKLDLDLSKSGEGGNSEDEEEDHLNSLEAGTWYVKFTNEVPFSLNAELGAGKGEFDLTGLLLKNFVLSTGASSVVLRFDEPNKAKIETMKIETGLSKFVGESLGNANFNRFEFSGGVGSYKLDFTGELKNEVDVQVEVGLGSVTILIPRDVGARIFYEESWISKIDIDRDFTKKRDGQYMSDNYGTARGRMNIKVESGLGHVKIRRVRS
jgi:hypothetical protein